MLSKQSLLLAVLSPAEIDTFVAEDCVIRNLVALNIFCILLSAGTNLSS